jgi:hypothetical protein
MIGTPDPISNLRPVKYYIPPNETAEEKEWRESCIKVDAFNEDFWHRNNTLFVQAKSDYENSCKDIQIYACESVGIKYTKLYLCEYM